jgi:hypothetical protein
VPVHSRAAPIEQDRATVAITGSSVDRPPPRGRQRHQHDLAAFADHAQHAVSVFLADIADIRRARFEHA